MNIDDISESIKVKQVLSTNQADEEAEENGLEFEAIYYSVFGGENRRLPHR